MFYYVLVGQKTNILMYQLTVFDALFNRSFILIGLSNEKHKLWLLTNHNVKKQLCVLRRLTKSELRWLTKHLHKFLIFMVDGEWEGYDNWTWQLNITNWPPAVGKKNGKLFDMWKLCPTPDALDKCMAYKGSNLVKIIMQGKVGGTRKKGRAKSRWFD